MSTLSNCLKCNQYLTRGVDYPSFFMLISIRICEKNVDNEGTVYALVNPCVVGKNGPLIKIGKTVDLERRRKELYNTSVPMQFEPIQAKIVSDMDRTERYIHAVLEPHRYNPSREFFECSHSVVDGIFSLISGENLMETTYRDDIKDDCEYTCDDNDIRKRRPTIKFSDFCENGSIFVYRDDPLITCKVSDAFKNRVMYDGEETSLTAIVNKLKGLDTSKSNTRYRGPEYWVYNGKRLDVIYEELYPKTN